MVRMVRVLVLALAALACLVSCNFWVSIFPGRLTSYEAYADVSGYIDEEWVFGFDFQIVRDSTTGAEYLVLVNDDRSFDGVHLVAYDTNLDVLGKFTLAQLDAWNTGAPFKGRTAMVDALGRIVVGNRRFTVGSTGLAYADTPAIMPGYNGLAIPEAVPEPNFHNFRAGGSGTLYLNYDTSPVDWTTTSPGPSVSVGTGTVGKFAGAWVQDSLVFMMIYTEYEGMRVFQVPRAEFAVDNVTNFTAISTAPVVNSQTAWQTLGFAYDGTTAGFAVYCWMDTAMNKNRYVRFSVDGMLLATSDEIPEYERPYEQRHVYGREAGWYIFDPRRMAVERRAWWWK